MSKKNDNVSGFDDSNSESEDTKSNVTVTREFQEKVIKYVKMDDLIRKKQKELSELKKQRKPCEEFILKYLANVDESTIEITGGKLIRNKAETKESLKQEYIKEAISEKVQDPKVVEEILQLMESKRPRKTRVNIKRTSVRKKN